ncbi:MAG: hypothetical protein IKY66_03450 [Bacteroidales bacterium]|nr:hypothetical protein [Bacteroidales bacterium]
MKKKTLLEIIIDFLFGHKYYANVIHVKGTTTRELSCFIFYTKEQAQEHRVTLDETRSFGFVETVSFRSREDYSESNR